MNNKVTIYKSDALFTVAGVQYILTIYVTAHNILVKVTKLHVSSQNGVIQIHSFLM